MYCNCIDDVPLSIHIYLSNYHILKCIKGEDSTEDGDLTVMGEVIARLPIDVQLGKLIVLGHIFGILDEAIIIAAG